MPRTDTQTIHSDRQTNAYAIGILCDIENALLTQIEFGASHGELFTPNMQCGTECQFRQIKPNDKSIALTNLKLVIFGFRGFHFWIIGYTFELVTLPKFDGKRQINNTRIFHRVLRGGKEARR